MVQTKAVARVMRKTWALEKAMGRTMVLGRQMELPMVAVKWTGNSRARLTKKEKMKVAARPMESQMVDSTLMVPPNL